MSPAGFLVPRVGGDGLNRVGNKAALDDMGSERDVRPLCPRSAFWCHELVAMGFVVLGTKLRSMTWVVNETSGRYVPGRLFALGTKLRSVTWVVNETSGRYVPGRLFGCHELVAVNFIALGTKLRSMTWEV